MAVAEIGFRKWVHLGGKAWELAGSRWKEVKASKSLVVGLGNGWDPLQRLGDRRWSEISRSHYS